MKSEAQNLRPISEHLVSPEGIKEYTEYLMNFIQDPAESTVPYSKPSTRAAPWWTYEIEGLVLGKWQQEDHGEQQEARPARWRARY